MRSRSPRSWPLDCAEWLAARRCRVRTSCVNARRPWRAAARLRCVVACGACCLAGVPGAVGPGRCVCWWAVPYPRMLLVVLVASLVLRVSSGLAAVCAGGLLAVRAASFARRVVSKPGLAPPPPTSTAARPAGPSGALHTGGAVSLMCGALARNPARLSSPQSGPAFASQASCPALAHIAAESTPNFARNSPATISNIEFRSLELQRFRTLLKLRSIELRARF